MAAYTYSELVAALLTTTEESGDEYTAAIDSVIIKEAEARILRDLKCDVFTTTAAQPMTSGTTTVAKPTDLISELSLFYTDATGAKVFLEHRTSEFLDMYWSDATDLDAPRYYCDSGESNWRLAPTPNLTADVSVHYILRPTGLSSGVTTTFLASKLGDLLLLACLVESERYLKDDGRSAMWKAEYAERLADAMVELAPHMIHNAYILK